MRIKGRDSMGNPKQKFLVAIAVLVLAGGLLLLHGWCIHRGPQPGTVLDEARQAGRATSSFLVAYDGKDYFHDMDQNKDGVVELTPEEVEGRITWVVWTGGNDRLWSRLTTDSLGALDFLKTVSSRPSLSKFSRDNRWSYLGLVNEPCFEKPTGPDPQRHGLWVDKRRPDCSSDPFENGKKYPGVAIGEIGRASCRERV